MDDELPPKGRNHLFKFWDHLILERLNELNNNTLKFCRQMAKLETGEATKYGVGGGLNSMSAFYS